MKFKYFHLRLTNVSPLCGMNIIALPRSKVTNKTRKLAHTLSPLCPVKQRMLHPIYQNYSTHNDDTDYY